MRDDPYGNPLCNGYKPQPSTGTGGGTNHAAETIGFHRFINDIMRGLCDAMGILRQYLNVPDAETIAVDFDGTLCENRFPDVGEPIPAVIEYIKRQAALGAKIILHTCRENGNRPLLEEAVAFCVKHEIPLYAVNENPDNPYTAQYGTGTARKVYADLYIDDKALNVREIISGKAPL